MTKGVQSEASKCNGDLNCSAPKWPEIKQWSYTIIMLKNVLFHCVCMCVKIHKSVTLNVNYKFTVISVIK